MLYQPIPNAAPISRHTARCRRARIIDGYWLDGQLIQTWRLPDGSLLQGPADTAKHNRILRPVQEIA